MPNPEKNKERISISARSLILDFIKIADGKRIEVQDIFSFVYEGMKVLERTANLLGFERKEILLLALRIFAQETDSIAEDDRDLISDLIVRVIPNVIELLISAASDKIINAPLPKRGCFKFN